MFHFNFKRKIYDSLPVSIKEYLLFLPFSIIAGKSYKMTIERGKWIEFATREEILKYQEKKLSEILSFACNHVPAYKGLKNRVEKLSPFEALKVFPLINKDLLQSNLENYLPDIFHEIPHFECTTGGTTGNQLRIFLDDNSRAVEIGFMHRQWSRVGYKPICKKATFRGVEFNTIKNDVYWQLNPIYNELQFSPYHMNNDTIDKYISALLKYKPQYLHGYPSAITLLSNFINDHHIDSSCLNINAILLGSEALYADQRESIEKAFNTRAFSWYGQSEQIILAGECEKSNVYHHFPDYGFLEFIDDDGNIIEKEGDSGEIIGTGFLNKAMPLIRYKTGDHARKLDYRCDCKRNFDRFDKVRGRWKQEYVVGKNGSMISVAALNIHGPIFKGVDRYQYYQKNPGQMELRIMVNDSFSEKQIEDIRSTYKKKTGDELDIEVKIVEDIPLTKRGKLRRLIQEISLNK